MNEDQLVAYFKGQFPASGKYVRRWGGDDGALVEIAAKNQVSVLDMMVEGVHFDCSMSSYQDVGYKSVSVNLSDLAACGAEPVYVMLGLAAPAGFETGAMRQFYDGFLACLEKWDVEFAGGDFSRSEKLTITVAAVGQLEKGAFWARNGAQPGDYVYITGQPGLSSVGLDILRGKQLACEGAVEKQQSPDPPLMQSRYLRNNGVPVSACCDVSDGLSTELNHLAVESGACFEVDLSGVPIPAVTSGLEYALNGGEDYELLFTTAIQLDCEDFLTKCGSSLHCIGRVKEGSGVISTDGQPIQPAGYDHCSSGL